MSAIIKFDQSGLPPGENNRSREDIVAGTPVTITNVAPGSSQNDIELLWKPPEDDTAAISGSSPTWEITPKAGTYGRYRVRLVVDGEEVIHTFDVLSPILGLPVLAANERANPDATLVDMGTEKIEQSETNHSFGPFTVGSAFGYWRDLAARIVSKLEALFDPSSGHDHSGTGDKGAPTAHSLRVDNPHSVTAAQVGAPASPHAIGGSDHSASTLAEVNTKISDATLDDAGDPRPPSSHALDPSSGPHTGTTPEATVVFDGSTGHDHSGGTQGNPVDYGDLENVPGSFTPSPHNLAGSEHNADTLANLNSKISDGTVIDKDSPNTFTRKQTITPSVEEEAFAANGASVASGTGKSGVVAQAGAGGGAAGDGGAAVVGTGGASQVTANPGSGIKGTGGTGGLLGGLGLEGNAPGVATPAFFKNIGVGAVGCGLGSGIGGYCNFPGQVAMFGIFDAGVNGLVGAPSALVGFGTNDGGGIGCQGLGGDNSTGSGGRGGYFEAGDAIGGTNAGGEGVRGTGGDGAPTGGNGGDGGSFSAGEARGGNSVGGAGLRGFGGNSAGTGDGGDGIATTAGAGGPSGGVGGRGGAFSGGPGGLNADGGRGIAGGGGNGDGSGNGGIGGEYWGGTGGATGNGGPGAIHHGGAGGATSGNGGDGAYLTGGNAQTDGQGGRGMALWAGASAGADKYGAQGIEATGGAATGNRNGGYGGIFTAGTSGPTGNGGIGAEGRGANGGATSGAGGRGFSGLGGAGGGGNSEGGVGAFGQGGTGSGSAAGGNGIQSGGGTGGSSSGIGGRGAWLIGGLGGGPNGAGGTGVDGLGGTGAGSGSGGRGGYFTGGPAGTAGYAGPGLLADGGNSENTANDTGGAGGILQAGWPNGRGVIAYGKHNGAGHLAIGGEFGPGTEGIGGNGERAIPQDGADEIKGSAPNMSIKLNNNFHAHAAFVGLTIEITGATTPGNNGLFTITSIIDKDEVAYTNASGVAESFPGIAYILNGVGAQGGYFIGGSGSRQSTTGGDGLVSTGGNGGSPNGNGGPGVRGYGGAPSGSGIGGAGVWGISNNNGGNGVKATGDSGGSPVGAAFHIDAQDADPSNGTLGDFIITSSSHPSGQGHFRYHNGSTWVQII